MEIIDYPSCFDHAWWVYIASRPVIWRTPSRIAMMQWRHIIFFFFFFVDLAFDRETLKTRPVELYFESIRVMTGNRIVVDENCRRTHLCAQSFNTRTAHIFPCPPCRNVCRFFWKETLGYLLLIRPTKWSTEQLFSYAQSNSLRKTFHAILIFRLRHYFF